VPKNTTFHIGAQADTATSDSTSAPTETAPLLPSSTPTIHTSQTDTDTRSPQPASSSSSPSLHTNRTHLKGTIAGIYSLSGGLGILILTKVGGLLFDRERERSGGADGSHHGTAVGAAAGAPFFMLAAFHAALLVAVVGVALLSDVRRTAEGGFEVLGKEDGDNEGDEEGDDEDRDDDDHEEDEDGDEDGGEGEAVNADRDGREREGHHGDSR